LFLWYCAAERPGKRPGGTISADARAAKFIRTRDPRAQRSPTGITTNCTVIPGLAPDGDLKVGPGGELGDEQRAHAGARLDEVEVVERGREVDVRDAVSHES
jgi:hypothetical protein